MLRFTLLLFFILTARQTAAQEIDTSQVNVLDYSTLVLTTSLDMDNPVSDFASFWVRQGYTLNFAMMHETQFSMQEREVIVAEDLEYKVKLSLFVRKVKQDPLPVFHVGIVWRYGDENGSGLSGATPPEIVAYKEKYAPIYTKRIWHYIDRTIKRYDHTLLTHPLVEENS